MSNEGYPSWKECKRISKTHSRHTWERSQISYKITTETFPNPAHVPLAHSGYKITTGPSSSNFRHLGAHFSSVQFSSVAQLCPTLWPHGLQHARPPYPSPAPGLLKLMSVESVMPSNHLISCCPLLPPSIFPSIRVFSSESVLHIRWPKYWSFNFSISPSNEYSGLISFRMDWLDLLAVWGTLKSLLQHHSSKASVFQHSAFFTVQLSYPYMPTGKTIALTRWTFILMSLLFKMLSRLVIAFSQGARTF